uniref:Uncharacterized protein n=1 Tax=Romanomermis culicivorax TaxID=13658 RepID=A0A915JVM5_ROMCU
MGRKKIQISRIQDERNRQLGNVINLSESLGFECASWTCTLVTGISFALLNLHLVQETSAHYLDASIGYSLPKIHVRRPCCTSSDSVGRQSNRTAIRHWPPSADTGLQFRSS